MNICFWWPKEILNWLAILGILYWLENCYYLWLFTLSSSNGPFWKEILGFYYFFLSAYALLEIYPHQPPPMPHLFSSIASRAHYLSLHFFYYRTRWNQSIPLLVSLHLPTTHHNYFPLDFMAPLKIFPRRNLLSPLKAINRPRERGIIDHRWSLKHLIQTHHLHLL